MMTQLRSTTATCMTPTDPAAELLDDGTAAFAAVRRRLFGIAYRAVGSWTEAEDIVQEVWLRWQAYDRSTVLSSTAFLVTTTTRLAINATQTARARHDSYVGEWAHEPVSTDTDPSAEAVQSDQLERGIRLLLERLSPAERAAYVLREAFDYPYSRIAGLLDVTEVNARQLVSRAGKRLGSERHTSVRSSQRRRLVAAFLAAARAGELAALEALFVHAAHQPV